LSVSIDRGGSGPLATSGFTLLEVILAAALVLMLGALAVGFLNPSLRALSRGSTRADMQQDAMVALGRLCADLQATATSAVGLLNPEASGPGPVVISLVRVETTAPPTGEAQWETSVIAYVWDRASERVVRRVFATANPVISGMGLSGLSPRRADDATLTRMASMSNPAGDEVLAIGVKQFRVATAGSGKSYVSPPFTIRIEMARAGSHRNEPERYVMTRSVTTRNHE